MYQGKPGPAVVSTKQERNLELWALLLGQSITSDQFIEKISVPRDETLPKVNVVFIDSPHPGMYSFPVLPEHTLANRDKHTTNYKANINKQYGVKDIAELPSVIAAHQDEADFTLVDIGTDISLEELSALEQNILKMDKPENIFFAGFKNDNNKRKRLHVTGQIPTVSYDNLSKMAHLTWNDITMKREKPRLGFWERLAPMWGAYTL